MWRDDFKNRIRYQGDLVQLLQQVAVDYNLGDYRGHEIVETGYEDLNVIVKVTDGKYFVKIFASFRSYSDCIRYTKVMEKVIKAGISFPALLKSAQGCLYKLHPDRGNVYLCVFEYIDGKTFAEMHKQPANGELQEIVRQATRINMIPFKPESVYDHWAIPNILKEFEEKKQYLGGNDLKLVTPVVEYFRKVDHGVLPQCFVHGDLISTNVMRNITSKLYILDFAVSNYYPRIIELAVLFCDLFFDEYNPQEFINQYEFGVHEYQKNIPLNKIELDLLPLYTKAAHVMHIILPMHEWKVKQNNSPENQRWLQKGRAGLEYLNACWENL